MNRSSPVPSTCNRGSGISINFHSTERTSLDREGDEIIERYGQAMDDYLLHVGGTEAWNLVARANAYVETSAPWTLQKDGAVEHLDTVLAALARSVSRITVMAAPFMPSKTQEVWQALGLPGTVQEATWDFLGTPAVGGNSVVKPKPIFPKPE